MNGNTLKLQLIIEIQLYISIC